MVGMLVEDGRDKGIVSPVRSLTKMVMVSSGVDEVAECTEASEPVRERMSSKCVVRFALGRSNNNLAG
jgi:hypothetical protein